VTFDNTVKTTLDFDPPLNSPTTAVKSTGSIIGPGSKLWNVDIAAYRTYILARKPDTGCCDMDQLTAGVLSVPNSMGLTRFCLTSLLRG